VAHLLGVPEGLCAVASLETPHHPRANHSSRERTRPVQDANRLRIAVERARAIGEAEVCTKMQKRNRLDESERAEPEEKSGLLYLTQATAPQRRRHNRAISCGKLLG
jgi:hypothetical protein